MAASLRTHRALVFSYSATSPDGYVVETYTREDSAADDAAWWCSRGLPTGREYQVGGQMAEAADVVLGFADYVPVTQRGLVQIGADVYRVLAVLPRENGHADVQALAVRASQAEHNMVAS